jgi:small conductance mechanosensitive channel
MQTLLSPENLSNLTELGIRYGLNLLFAILIFLIGKWIAKRVVRVVERLMTKSRMDVTLASFVSNVLYSLLLVLVIITALSKLGINTTSAVAILGGMALAVGMALKDQLSSFAAGVMIIVFRPFVVGDQVEIAGIFGKVQQIKIVFTELLTANNQTVIIPNSEITTSPITNYTTQMTRRIQLPIGVGYGADIKKSREIMLRIANSDERVLADPEARVGVTSLGDNAVELTLYAWTQTSDYFLTSQALTEEIKIALDEAGIDIPFPQRTIHVEGLAEAMGSKQEG